VVARAEWPDTPEGLIAAQQALAAEHPRLWTFRPDALVGGCFAVLPRGISGLGTRGEPVWAGAATFRRRRCVGRATALGATLAGYHPGLLALRLGPVLHAAVRELPELPDVLLVDATGLDHPRRAGLATHLGAVLDVPTIGVTHRTLLARGEWPSNERGAASPLLLDGTLVGHWLRTRVDRRPVAVHAAWRTDPDTAARVVRAVSRHRTPAPLREARRLARRARSVGVPPAARQPA
jgi:deoxyribonuclease V